MPSVLSVVYFVFIVLYYFEMQKQTGPRWNGTCWPPNSTARIRSKSLRRMQEAAAAYRHDMRHHIAMLQGMASEGQMEKIKTT